MEREKTPKKKPDNPSIDDYLLLKNWGEHDNGQVKMLKILFYKEGTWQRGDMAKGITVILFNYISNGKFILIFEFYYFSYL